MEEVEEPADQLTESPTKQSFTQEDIDKFACLDDSILSTPHASVSGDNDNSTSSHKTPGKRSSGKQIALETTGMEGQFSSTFPSSSRRRRYNLNLHCFDIIPTFYQMKKAFGYRSTFLLNLFCYNDGYPIYIYSQYYIMS
ncbi:hypothetical protein QL285_031524 [Trifolium repens]|nr:hypothetical protein QL285_031524 [Trifolium repens]